MIKFYKNNKFVQLSLTSILPVLFGVISTKLISLYLPVVYLGYLGLLKSSIFFISALILLGLNHSYYYLERESFAADRVELDNFCIIQTLCIFLLLIFFVFVSVVYFELNKDVILFISICLSISLLTSVLGINAKSSSVDNNFSLHPVYNSSQNIIILFLVVLLFFIEELYYSIVLINIFILLILFYQLYVKRVHLLDKKKLTYLFKKNISYSKYFQILLIATTSYSFIIQSFLNSVNEAVLFNVVITISTFLGLINASVCNYIAPKIIKDEKYDGLSFFYWVTFVSLFLSLAGIVYFFDNIVSILFKDSLIFLSNIVIILLLTKTLEFLSNVLSYKYYSTMNFKFIYIVYCISYAPSLFYLIFSSSFSVFDMLYFSYLFMFCEFFKINSFIIFCKVSLFDRCSMLLSVNLISFYLLYLYF